MPRSKKKERKFSYAPMSKDTVEKSSHTKGEGFNQYLKSGITQFRPEKGRNKIRLLPFIQDGKNMGVGYEIKLIYGVGVDNQTFADPTWLGMDEDPIAEARNEANREGDEKLFKALKPKSRVLHWIIDRNKESEGPMLWSCPVTLNAEIAKQILDEDGMVVPVDHPDEGYDIIFEREGEKLNTEYGGVKIARTSSPVHDDEDIQDEWLEYVEENPLPDLILEFSADYLRKVVEGKTPPKEEEEEEDIPGEVDGRDPDKSSRTRRGLNRLKKGKEDTDDDDDDPEEKPARGRGRTRRKRSY